MAIICCMLAITSCEEDWDEPFLNISQTEYKVGNEAEQIIIPIETNLKWQVVSALPAWITIENMEGSGSAEIMADIAQNGSFSRSCELIIAAGTESQTVKISQTASTSGKLSVETGDCDVTGLLGKYTLTINFKVTNPHLASRAGVEINGKEYDCEGTISSSYNYVQVTVNSLGVIGTQYRAYAVEKSTGKRVYGSTKTINR